MGSIPSPASLLSVDSQQVVCQAYQAVCKALIPYTSILVVLASVAASKKYSKEQVVVQLGVMHLMIEVTPLKSEYGQLVVKTRTKT